MIPLPTLKNAIECDCELCRSACDKKPGWFLPEEIKPLADYLGLTEQQLFDKYLGVDYFGKPSHFQFVLSPLTNKCEPGKEFPFDPLGTCVFYKDQKCSIHAVKPFECKLYDHNDKRNTKESTADHEAVADVWDNHQDKIKHLLGREPEVTPPDVLEMLGILANLAGGRHPFGD